MKCRKGWMYDGVKLNQYEALYQCQQFLIWLPLLPMILTDRHLHANVYILHFEFE